MNHSNYATCCCVHVYVMINFFGNYRCKNLRRLPYQTEFLEKLMFDVSITQYDTALNTVQVQALLCCMAGDLAIASTSMKMNTPQTFTLYSSNALHLICI